MVRDKVDKQQTLSYRAGVLRRLRAAKPEVYNVRVGKPVQHVSFENTAYDIA